MAVVSGGGKCEIGKAILDALGIKAMGVDRIVIEINPRDLVRVYIRRVLFTDEEQSIIDAMKKAAGQAEVIEADVTVDEKGNVKRSGSQ